MNVNEYGVVLQFGVGFNISGYSTLSITFTKPDLTTLTVTNPAITVGSMTIATTAGTFNAGTYALYTFVNGDVNVAGIWSARLTYTDATPAKLISNIVTFTINP